MPGTLSLLTAGPATNIDPAVANAADSITGDKSCSAVQPRSRSSSKKRQAGSLARLVQPVASNERRLLQRVTGDASTRPTQPASERAQSRESPASGLMSSPAAGAPSSASRSRNAQVLNGPSAERRAVRWVAASGGNPRVGGAAPAASMLTAGQPGCSTDRRPTCSAGGPARSSRISRSAGSRARAEMSCGDVNSSAARQRPGEAGRISAPAPQFGWHTGSAAACS
eukprot:SAG22_NODE_183_length_16031_cov_36.647000_2_plen_226_part_00